MNFEHFNMYVDSIGRSHSDDTKESRLVRDKAINLRSEVEKDMNNYVKNGAAAAIVACGAYIWLSRKSMKESGPGRSFRARALDVMYQGVNGAVKLALVNIKNNRHLFSNIDRDDMRSAEAYLKEILETYRHIMSLCSSSMVSVGDDVGRNIFRKQIDDVKVWINALERGKLDDDEIVWLAGDTGAVDRLVEESKNMEKKRKSGQDKLSDIDSSHRKSNQSDPMRNYDIKRDSNRDKRNLN